MWFFILLACTNAPTRGENIQIGDETLLSRFASIEERQKNFELEQVSDLKVLIEKMERIEERLSSLEMSIADLQPPTYSARKISFDPRQTKLSAEELQGALEEITKRLRSVEEKTEQDMGQPGAGLFQNINHGSRKTDRGQPHQGPPPEQAQGQKGPGGPPPGGNGQQPGGGR